MTKGTLGLVSRTLVKHHTFSCVEVQEVWNVATPGCPVIVIDLATGHVNTDATTVTRNILMGADEWKYGACGETAPAKAGE